MSSWIVLLWIIFGQTLAQYLPDAEVQKLSPTGIEFKVKDFAGLEEVGVHYNINKDLPGRTGGLHNYEVTHKSRDGYWHHRNPAVLLHDGDRVNYWLYFKINGIGQVKTDLHWTVDDGHTGSHQGGSNTGGSHTGETHTGGSHTAPHQTPSTDLHLIFQDDFSSGTVDTRKWKYEVSAFGGGNWEFQVYTNEQKNTYIKNGILYMMPTLTADKFGENFLRTGHMDVRQIWGECTDDRWYGCVRDARDAFLPPVMSSKLISKTEFKYGRVEIVVQIPMGDWIWPAIWLMPKDFAYGGWPASGEIDMVEARCNRQMTFNGEEIGIQRMMSTLHWGPKPEQDSWQRTTQGKILNFGTWASDFHTYTMDWDENGIVISADGVPVLNRPTPSGGYFQFGNFGGSNPWSRGSRDAPFDKLFHFQMNVAVGGTLGFFPDNVQNADGPKPWCNTCPDAAKANQKFWEAKNQWYPTWKGEAAAMKVKSVKIWSR